MATKTLIVKPSSVTINDDSNVTFFPSDTSEASAHTLINETIADDDASYILLSTPGIISVNCKYTKPYDAVRITDYFLFGRIRCETANSNTSANTITVCADTFRDGIGDDSVISSRFQDNLAEAYVDNTITFTDSLQDEIVAYLDGLNSETDITFTLSVASSAKDTPTRITQFYLGIIYEASEEEASSETIYLRENGAWLATSGTIYQKQSGVWVATDSAIFENGDKFITKEIT